MKRAIGVVLACLAGLAAAGCANTAALNIEYAPRVAGAENIFSLAVLDFEGRGGVDFADTVESQLVTARFRGAPAVAVVDPGMAGPGFARGRFRHRYGSPASLAEAGAVMNVDGVISGTMLDERVSDSAYTRERRECVARDADGACVEYRTYLIECWNVRASVQARLLLVETLSAQTLFNDILSGSSSMYYCEDEHLPYTASQLVDQAMIDAARPVRRLFLPYEQVVHAPFARPDEGLDEPVAARFQAAYELTGDDRLEEACSAWTELAREGVETARLFYNLGLCAELRGMLEPALAQYERAIALSADPFNDAQRARDRVLVQMRERERLGG